VSWSAGADTKRLGTTFHTFVTAAFPTRHEFRRTVVCMTNKTATPWGPATLVEQASLPQRVGDKRFASVVELLETGTGERLVRIAYTTGGQARRGPVTLRLRDLERLRTSVKRSPGLAAALGWEDA
jgi:hypothetical protein